MHQDGASGYDGEVQRVAGIWRQVPELGPEDRTAALAAAVEEALALLPLHLELIVRESFGLPANPKLEDICPGALDDALRLLTRADICAGLQEFVA